MYVEWKLIGDRHWMLINQVPFLYASVTFRLDGFRTNSCLKKRDTKVVFVVFMIYDLLLRL